MRRWLTGMKGEREGGFLLIVTLVQGLTILTVLTGVMSLSLFNLGSAKRSQQALYAQYAAEAGGDRFMYEINKDNNYAGTNTVCPIGTTGSNPVTLYEDTRGKATYETCATAGTIDSEKIVYAVGKFYAPATKLRAIKKLRLVISG